MKKIALFTILIGALSCTSCEVLSMLLEPESNSGPAKKEMEAPTHTRVEQTPTKVSKGVMVSDANSLLEELGLQGSEAESFKGIIIKHNKERKQVKLSDMNESAAQTAMANIMSSQNDAVKQLLTPAKFEQYLSLVGSTARSNSAGSLKVGGGE